MFNLQEAIILFVEAWKEGWKNIEKASKVYVQVLDSAPNLADEFRKAIPQISIEVWYRLEKVGRGEIISELLMYAHPAANRVMKNPISVQRSVLMHGIPVARPDGEILYVALEDMTPFFMKQVFKGCKIRSPKAQMAWLKSQQMEATVKNTRWKVRGNKVRINKACTLTRGEVSEILREMS